MNYTHSITSKGQITIPKEFRDKLGLDKVGKATLRLNEAGEIVLTTPKSLQDVRALLQKPTFKDGLSAKEKTISDQLVKKYDARRH
jgi:antitoxin PrlF